MVYPGVVRAQKFEDDRNIHIHVINKNISKTISPLDRLQIKGEENDQR